MGFKIVICIIAVTYCTSGIFQCIASAVTSKPSRSLGDLTKIYQGRFVRITEYPFIVSLQDSFSQTCGGSLVTPVWVLTASHCFDNTDPTDPKVVASITVVAGRTAVSRYTAAEDPGGPNHPNRRKVTKIILHEEYHEEHPSKKALLVYWNDIALVTLESSFGKDIVVQLVTLPPPDLDEPKDCVAIGWGKQKDDPSDKTRSSNLVESEAYPDQEEHPDWFVSLKAVDLKIVDSFYCTDPKGFNSEFLGETQLCVDTRGRGNTCQGDSGGPLVHDGMLLGLTSYSATDNCSTTKMAVYTRVSKYREWIAKYVTETENTNSTDGSRLVNASVSLVVIMCVLAM